MPEETIQQFVQDRQPSIPNRNADSDGPLHPLALTTKELLTNATPNAEGLIDVASPALHARVSLATTERSVEIWDKLIKLWEKRGGSVLLNESTNTSSPPTTLALGPDSFGVLLAENIDDSKRLTDPSRLMEKLTLHITGDEKHRFRRRWSDTKSQRLERMLKAFVDTLMNALAVKRQERLDVECVARQRAKAEAVRKVASQSESREFYWRQELMQHAEQWHAAQKVRAYLNAWRTAIDSGTWQPGNKEQFDEWLNWAVVYAHAIDPISRKPLLGAAARVSQNSPAADLDLTLATREAVNRLGVADTDALWKASQESVRKACEGKFGPVWNEISRVLEGRGYDVSKRETVSEWW